MNIQSSDIAFDWLLNNPTQVIDRQSNLSTVSISSFSTENTCPEEDLDGDGVAAWEDCDDNDANPCEQPISDPLAEFKFDEGSGQVISDSSGNGYSGQLGETTGVDTSDPTWNNGYLTFFRRTF